MNNGIDIKLPPITIDAFPILKDASYVRSFSSLITLYPDTVYYLFQKTPKKSFVLVATDHPDPTYESQQLKELSGKFAIEFIHIIKPHNNGQYIKIRKDDNISDLFFVRNTTNYYCYYLTEAKHTLDW